MSNCEHNILFGLCKAECCGLVPLSDKFVQKYKDKIVNTEYKKIDTGMKGYGKNTTQKFIEFSPKWDDLTEEEIKEIREISNKEREGKNLFIYMTKDSRCIFLTKYFTCNIYENRPDVCRLFGEENTSHPFLRCTVKNLYQEKNDMKEVLSIMERIAGE